MTQEAHPVCVHPVCVEHALQVWHLNLDLKYWVRLPCVQTCYPTRFLNGAFIILPGPAPLTYAPSSEGSLGLRPLALRPSHFPALYSALRNVSSLTQAGGKAVQKLPTPAGTPLSLVLGTQPGKGTKQEGLSHEYLLDTTSRLLFGFSLNATQSLSSHLI